MGTVADVAAHTHDGIDWAARLEHMHRNVALEAAALSGIAGRLVTETPAGTATVIDLGCGAGGMSAAFAAAMDSGILVLVDAVPELLDAAVREARAAAGDGLEVRSVLADAAAEDLAELVPPADLVWVSHVLHHLPDEMHAAGSFARLLRPGGRLALGEGGLPTRCLPWDIGLGEPGLEHRLEVARNEWFTAMRENIPDSVRLPIGWNLLLAEIGLTDLETFSYLVHHPAPTSQDVRDMAAERLAWFAEIGVDRLSAEDLAVLHRLLDPADDAFVAARDDVYLLSTRTVYIGRTALDGTSTTSRRRSSTDD